MITTIYTMGELLTEFLPRNPHQKFTRPGEFIGSFPSGAPAIFAAQMTKLSRRTIFFGCVGNDDSARLIIERLRCEGVITDGIHVTNDAVTDTTFVSYQNPQQQDFVFSIPNSACGLFTAEHIDKDLLRQCNHLCVVGSSLLLFRMIDVIRRAITTIKSAGGAVPFDPNIRKEMLGIPEMTQTLDYLIEYTDTFIPSESELPFFAHHKNLSRGQIVSGLLHGSVKYVVIKRAQRRASYYKLKSNILHAQHVVGHDVEIINPTGTGNYFDATFITLSLSGFPVRRALRYANASDTLVVIRQGPTEGISSLADIEDFLQQRWTAVFCQIIFPTRRPTVELPISRIPP